ncbi:MAG: YbhB/YbcL family Raf kinase inhibitor-like protein [Phycisphaeraceae bacterium]
MLQTGKQSVGSILVRSDAFEDGHAIPRDHTADGEDASPSLIWSRVPEGTQSLALICDDPDAMTLQPWVHWVLYNLPGTLTLLPPRLPRAATLERPASVAGALQGKNSWTSMNLGYRGPNPPAGKAHRYRFHLFALDTKLDVPPGIDKNALIIAMRGRILGEGTLTGTYKK